MWLRVAVWMTVAVAWLCSSVASLKTVYIIRHCDDIEDDSPCCSLVGYDRANTWNRLFDAALEDKKLTLYSPGADYDTATQCKPNIKITNQSSCQKSQRMALTAKLINYNSNSEVDVKMDYCTGQYQKVVSDITDAAADVQRALIVWQHTEIVSIINAWNVPLTKWPTDLDLQFDIVFRLSFATDTDSHPTLAYNCYDYQRNVLSCSEAVKQWLQPYATFDVTLPVVK